MKKFFIKIKLVWHQLGVLAPSYRRKEPFILLVFALIECYGGIISPYLIQSLFHALEANTFHTLYLTCLVNTGIVLVFFVLCYLNNVYLDLISFQIILQATKQYCDILYQIPYDVAMQRYGDSELHNRIDQGSNVLCCMLGLAVRALSYTIIIAVLLFMSGNASWILLLFALISVALGIAFTKYESKRRKQYEVEKQKTEAEIDRTLFDFTHQIITVLVYRMQDKVTEEYRKSRTKAWSYMWKQEKLSLLTSSLVELFSSFLRGGMALSFYPMRLNGRLSDERIASSFSIFDKIRGIARVYSAPISQFNANMAVLDRTDEVLSLYSPKERNTADGLDACAIAITGASYQIADKILIENINLKIQPGEKVAVIGLNGCGKSTLLKVICGVNYNFSGIVEIMGKDIKRLSNEERRKLISYIPSNSYLYSQSIEENIKMNADEEASSDYEEAKRKAQFDSDMENEKPAASLSGGQGQRVNIARGLMNKAKILIADEPAAGLPLDLGNQIIQQMVESYETAVVVTHHVENLKYFNRVILMEKGAILADSTPEKIAGLQAFRQWKGI